MTKHKRAKDPEHKNKAIMKAAHIEQSSRNKTALIKCVAKIRRFKDPKYDSRGKKAK